VTASQPVPAPVVDAETDQTPTLSVVLPTMNEAGGVAECIQKISSAAEAMRVDVEIIVSDSSTDQTPAIARDHGAVVVTPDRPGYGSAYRHGFRHARGEYIAMGDADTTYDFEELPHLCRAVVDGDADMVLGSRFKGEIRPNAMPPLHRYVGNPVLTETLNMLYRGSLTDAHSGMRVFSRDALKQLDLRSDGMEFASEMLMEALMNGLTIEEVPITYHERTGEATLESFRDGWRHLRFMVGTVPGYLFGDRSPGPVASRTNGGNDAVASRTDGRSDDV
jgi:glycosyltransferase involved in cell wall biosynthesis